MLHAQAQTQTLFCVCSEFALASTQKQTSCSLPGPALCTEGKESVLQQKSTACEQSWTKALAGHVNADWSGQPGGVFNLLCLCCRSLISCVRQSSTVKQSAVRTAVLAWLWVQLLTACYGLLHPAKEWCTCPHPLISLPRPQVRL